MEKNLLKVKSRVEGLIGLPIITSQPIHTGISNHNYIINHQWILKIRCVEDDPFYQPQTVLHINQLMHKIDCAPQMLFNLPDGLSLTNKISFNHHLPHHPSTQELHMIVRTINKLHEQDKNGILHFNLLERLNFYRKNCPPLFSQKIEELILSNYQKTYHQEDETLCHNDLVKNNFLFTRERLYIIDYDFAGINDPLFDDVSFISENNLTPEEQQEYLSLRYPSNLPDSMRIKAFMQAADLLWAYWAMFLFLKTKRKVFLTISNEKSARIKDALSPTYLSGKAL